MNIEIPSYVVKVMNTLRGHGYECYVVGGAVRSALLGEPVHDYDLSTNALPGEMKRVFSDSHTIETGIRHGTLTVMSEHHPVEITTWRKDAAYSDHRHPDSVAFTDALREDCARRDFTINAMCLDADGSLFDFFGGQKDLNSRIIRCIGVPEERLDEDALRILRALRFAARLDFEIEPATSAALRAKKDLLAYVSAERIRDELNGFFSAHDCVPLFAEYMEIFEVIFPELKELCEEERNRLLNVLARCPDDPFIRMTVLTDSFAHPEETMKRMKLSNREIRSMRNLIQLKSRETDTSAAIRRILRDLETDYAVYVNYRCAIDESADREAMMRMYEKIAEDGDCYRLRDLAVNGKDLLAAGFQGKEIAGALDLLLEEVIEKKLPNEKTALMDYIQKQDTK